MSVRDYILAEIGKKLTGKDEEVDGLTKEERIRYIQLRSQYDGLNSLYFNDDFPSEEYKELVRKAGLELFPEKYSNEEGNKLEDFLL